MKKDDQTLIYKGKTKDVFKLADGNCLLVFKDDVTGTDGVFDPGANTVGLKMEGAGKAGLKLSKYFFELLNAQKIPTHYISSDIDNGTMTVMPAVFFGKGIEVILRYRAVGSFVRRYGMYCKEGDKLDAYVEITLKDDQRNDPLITETALSMLNIMTQDEYAQIVTMTKKIGAIVKERLSEKGLELYDIKFEFGKIGKSATVALIDEISGGNMRAYKDGAPVHPLELEKIMTK